MPLRPRLARLLSALGSGDPSARRTVLLPGVPPSDPRTTAERIWPQPAPKEHYMTVTPRELAAQILDRITQYPDNFNMDSWMDGRDMLHSTDTVDCGTTLCVAGWAAHLSGYALFHGTNADGTTDVYCGRGGGTDDVYTVATGLLGLTRGQATELFYETNPRIATEMVRQLADGKPFNAQAAFEAAFPGRSPAATA